MDTSKYKALYLQETNTHLSGIEAGLLDLEKGSLSEVDNLFRHYHSIKGMSASMGYEPLKVLSHAEEDLLDRIRSKSLAPAPEIITTLFECLDTLKALVRLVEEDKPLDLDVSPLISRVRALSEGKQTPVPAQAPHETPVSAQAQAAPAGAELRISNVMKVEGRVFDELLTTVGDLFMALSSFKELSQRSRSIELKDGVHLLGKSVNALHKNILSARMLPIRDLTESLPRVVRDISGKAGKDVGLKIEGTEISLDRSILEDLGSPLVHIIRNAVDHGIETPSVRESAGKPRAGTITLSAYARRDRAVIEISDDGRGIDPEKIKMKAVEKGADPRKVAAMTRKESLMLVCLPGLTSAETVTETSGRGVGMDIVKAVVEGLGGALEIESEPGKGTTIRMELPRTTSIVKTLLVTAGSEQFLFPITKIERVIELSGEAPASIEYAGCKVPVVDLALLIGLSVSVPARSSTIVIVEREQEGPERGFVGFMVDDFGVELDAYIKPLLPPMSRLWGVAGITIMGDGRPVFLLDIPQILSRAANRLSS
ncbi:MAG: chemotaxis protein CheW [Deltaproteobacteria bacterium]|nr:chemotaxis protein CheW [Deltaproteobacteria bacterium]